MTGERRWLHRIGYGATIIVGAELIAGLLLGIYFLIEQHRRDAKLLEATRTHDGPIKPPVFEFELQGQTSFEPILPSIKTLAPDGIRFIAAPQLTGRWFAVSLRAMGAAVYGNFVLMEQDENGQLHLSTTRKFTIPSRVYQRMTSRVDRLTDGWEGESVLTVDGTDLSFERARGTKITSGEGNTPHYQVLSQIFHDSLAPFVPEITAVSWDWHSVK